MNNLYVRYIKEKCIFLNPNGWTIKFLVDSQHIVFHREEIIGINIQK